MVTILLKAEIIRLGKSLAFRLSLIGMLVLASAFIMMQATAMDYTVPLSRVIFLPMSMYGIVMAAFVSSFVGTNFSDGVIRNKLMAADNRNSIVVAQVIVSCIACVISYVVVTAFTTGIGQFFFENDVVVTAYFQNFILGIGMSLTTGCLFSIITLVSGNKTHAIIWCMGFAFGMLFLCLYTNEILVQTRYKDGAINPKYVGGFIRGMCGFLHDLNPCGQAAQLSSWEVWHPVRCIIVDLLLITGGSLLGCKLFRKKNIN